VLNLIEGAWLTSPKRMGPTYERILSTDIERFGGYHNVSEGLRAEFEADHQLCMELLAAMDDPDNSANAVLTHFAEVRRQYWNRRLIALGPAEASVIKSFYQALDAPIEDAIPTPKKRKSTAMIKLYKDGDHMSIVTEAKDEREFLENLAALLSRLIDSGRHEGDWEFQLMRWLPQTVDICCKMRGYKVETVRERTVLIAGDSDPTGASLEASIDERGDVKVEGETEVAEVRSK
jgi:hypothetical protein